LATPRGLRGLQSFNSRATIDVTGAQEVLDLMNFLGKDGQDAALTALVAKATVIRDRAKKLTPDDPETQGALVDSVRLSQTRKKSDGYMSVSIIAGGKPLEKRLKGHQYNAWALVQHEDTTLRHPHGGQAKFIEQPYLEVAPSVPGAVLDALDAATREGSAIGRILSGYAHDALEGKD